MRFSTYITFMDSDSLFFELFHNLPRQGPGDNESTAKAFSFLKELPPRITLLDIGCGSGMQTMQLAKLVNGHIIAIDFHEPFLHQLRTEIEQKGFADTITVLNKSMFEMDFNEESFDVIWSEGAVYLYGFRNALIDWNRLLKPGGYLVCSHLSWLDKNPPGELKTYWEAEYPEISDVDTILKTIGNEGYTPAGHFVLPEKSWWYNYYNPLQKRVDLLSQKYRHATLFKNLIDATKLEIYMFKTYSKYYGYVFYIMKKPSMLG